MVYDSRIFKNEEILSTEYLPELLPYRENQIQALANNLLPASERRKPQNTFLFGPPGIGKTACIKFVFKQFEEYSGIKTIYLNCWDYNTSVSILSKITLEMGIFVQRRGLGKDEVMEKFVESCKKNDKGIIVCLDEVDQLVYKDPNALYDLLRINQYIGNPFGLVFISNNPNVFMGVEPRIKSSLNIEEIEFKPYTLDEMKKILEDRIRLAFHSVEQGVVLICANHALENGGDVRIGLQCLQKAGRIAENENSNKLRVEHVKKVLSQVRKVKPEILKEKISKNEKKILEVLGNKRNVLSVDLYREYSSKVSDPVTNRVFRKYIGHLAEAGLITVRERKRKIKGRANVVSKA